MDKKTVRKILNYNRDTGIFTWKEKTSRKTVIGNIAGCVNSTGYIVIGYNGENYYAHRLAWLYCYSYFPKQLDHKDGNRKNNAIKNLRECSHSQNIYNAKRAIHNTSGYKGVSFHKAANKWEAYVCFENKKIYLGLFDTAEQASQEYLNAVKQIEPDFVRKK